MTYLTKEDWEQNFVQKICDDKSFSDNLQEKKKIFSDFTFLIQKIFKNNLPKKIIQRIIFSSLIYFYKYVLTNNITFLNLSLTEKLSLYSACIFLSFKTINKLVDIEKLSSSFQNLFNKDKKIKYEIEDIKELITKKEFEILFSIQFQINIDWPYDYFNLIKNYLSQIGIGNDSIKTVINFVNIKINEIILFPLYLYFTPIEILISTLNLIKEENKFNYININDFIKINSLDIDKDNLGECSLLINRIIKQKKCLEENNNININKLKIIKDNKEKEVINFNALSSIETNM